MCGRFTALYTWQELHELMIVSTPPDFAQRYNVAPTQTAPVVVQQPDGSRQARLMKWGLVPFWADDPGIGSRMINARGETVREKPAFRSAFAARRCVVPISGFYEWQALEGSKTKQPWYIHKKDGTPMYVAGLWEKWSKGDQPLESFTLITTSPNDLMRPIHDRMPVILDLADVGTWLRGGETDTAYGLIRPFPHSAMEAYRVSTRVNSPKNDDADCMQCVE